MRRQPRVRRLFLFLATAAAAAFGQSTQSLISGRVVDSEQGAPIAGATVSYLGLATNTGGTVLTDPSGYYAAPLLPPGKYRLRVSGDNYQSQELRELNLPVASSLEVNFRLRALNDIWEKDQYRSVFLPGTRSVLPFFGPDMDSTHLAIVDPNRGSLSPLETGISSVIDPVEISELPLAGRDVYAALVLQPGVAADTTTTRGLGYSVNGQRPSSSNYMLDGVENNNYLITGPLTVVAPEAVQEYRISTSNFSAEYGRTSGFITNAVTRSGGNRWHGIGYFDLQNEALNANSFEDNFHGYERAPFKQDEPGFQVGGPILKNRLFESLAVDYLRSRSLGEPQGIPIPTADFLHSDALLQGGLAAGLLQKYPPPAVPAGSPIGCNGFCALVNFQQPTDVDRLLGLERLDYVHGAQRIMARLVVSRLSRPDFIWSPYKDFDAPLNDNTAGLAIAWVSALRPNVTNELRGSLSADDLYWNRPHAEIPTLAAPALLPGSNAFYSYKNHSRNWELLDNLLWSRGKHIIKFGAGLLLRRLDGYLTAGQSGEYIFNSLYDFGADGPSDFEVSLDQQGLASQQNQIPNFNRKYSYNQYFLFAQDSFKVSPRLVLNYGVRYENFGAPKDTGPVKNDVIQLGAGTDFGQKLTTARLTFPQQGDQALYGTDNRDWSVRFGFGYSVRHDARTVIRGGYGIYYDRPFDNLWQNLANNNFVLSEAPLSAAVTNYLAPASGALSGLTFFPVAQFLTMYQGNIKNGYAQDYFLGVQQQITNNFTLEVNTSGSLGRRLITTDIVNREHSVPITDFENNPDGNFNPSVPDISYRGSQGSSNYNSLTATARYRGRRNLFQIAYTWSHAIDNQSDPLLGDFFSLDFTSISSGSNAGSQASFARQFDSSADRGNSDFDQRQNLVFYSIWEPPTAFSNSKWAPLFRNWRVSQVGAIRSGFPFTVTGYGGPPTSGGLFLPNRADLIDPNHAMAYTPVPGGIRLLNPAAFANPPADSLGNTGRNEFRGPGLYSIDLSVSRSFSVHKLGEGGRVILRGDFYNPLNHANLNNPQNTAFNPLNTAFGTAVFGRFDQSSGFPAVAPLNETARQVQLMLRVEF